MMTYFKLLAVALALLVSSSTVALDLKSAQKQKLVIELPNGDIKAAKGGNASLDKLVAEVNEKRRIHYYKIAAKRGIKVDVVRTQAAKMIKEKAKGK